MIARETIGGAAIAKMNADTTETAERGVAVGLQSTREETERPSVTCTGDEEEDVSYWARAPVTRMALIQTFSAAPRLIIIYNFLG